MNLMGMGWVVFNNLLNTAEFSTHTLSTPKLSAGIVLKERDI